jgi:hypothetical protein
LGLGLVVDLGDFCLLAFDVDLRIRPFSQQHPKLPLHVNLQLRTPNQVNNRKQIGQRPS